VSEQTALPGAARELALVDAMMKDREEELAKKGTECRVREEKELAERIQTSSQTIRFGQARHGVQYPRRKIIGRKRVQISLRR
jgi:hypothetical protein